MIAYLERYTTTVFSRIKHQTSSPELIDKLSEMYNCYFPAIYVLILSNINGKRSFCNIQNRTWPIIEFCAVYTNSIRTHHVPGVFSSIVFEKNVMFSGFKKMLVHAGFGKIMIKGNVHIKLPSLVGDINTKKTVLFMAWYESHARCSQVHVFHHLTWHSESWVNEIALC